MKIEIKRDYHKNGRIKYEHSYITGTKIRHGIQKNWYENGNLYVINSLKNDQWNKLNQYWKENGTRNRISSWKNSRYNGFEVTFNYEN